MAEMKCSLITAPQKTGAWIPKCGMDFRAGDAYNKMSLEGQHLLDKSHIYYLLSLAKIRPPKRDT